MRYIIKTIVMIILISAILLLAADRFGFALPFRTYDDLPVDLNPTDRSVVLRFPRDHEIYGQVHGDGKIDGLSGRYLKMSLFVRMSAGDQSEPIILLIWGVGSDKISSSGKHQHWCSWSLRVDASGRVVGRRSYLSNVEGDGTTHNDELSSNSKINDGAYHFVSFSIDADRFELTVDTERTENTVDSTKALSFDKFGAWVGGGSDELRGGCLRGGVIRDVEFGDKPLREDAITMKNRKYQSETRRA